MSAKVIAVTSRRPRAGKTHAAAALAAWLRSEGRHVAPLHLSAGGADPVPCPEGGAISHPAAVLADACGLPAEPVFEGGWAALDTLRQRYDVVVAELAAGAAVPAGVQAAELPVEQAGGFIRFGDYAPIAAFSPGLTPPCPGDVAALPPWTLGTAPRSGIISLPHLANFFDFRLLRGAEWLTALAPGRFPLLFLPQSLEPEKDVQWLAETGLDSWLASQSAQGARLIATGWDYPGAERVDAGALADAWTLSRILERRVPLPLPSEEILDSLVHWMAQVPGMAAFVHEHSA